MISVGYVAGIGERGSACRVLEGKHSVKRPSGRPRRRWKDIKMDIEKNRTTRRGLD